ncbi:probable pectinesterase 68 [Physcomitrium patens]|uniref:probable pectinesterase 68 n=1 Tax=Physcomitrium patens TaxID=3218 RepID=UPI003CCE30BD
MKILTPAHGGGGGGDLRCRKLAMTVLFSIFIFFQERETEARIEPQEQGFTYRNLLQANPATDIPSSGRSMTLRQIVVDANGLGDFLSVQAAVDAVPAENPLRVVIRINAGNYEEKVQVPRTLPYLTFQGAGAATTSISWNNIASDVGPDGKQLGSFNSATVMVFASNFIARDISFRLLQLYVEHCRGAATRHNCAFYGGQDTLCDDTGRHYFKNCYVQGSIDFVFGNGHSMYTGSTFHSIATSTGSIAAQDRDNPDDTSGFSFVGCQITGTGSNYLGRAMGKYSCIVYSECYIEDIILPQLWDTDWNHDGKNRDQTVTYGIYECWGPGVATSGQAWGNTMTQVEAIAFTSLEFIDGQEWLLEY